MTSSTETKITAEPVQVVGDFDQIQVGPTGAAFFVSLPPFGGTLTERMTRAVASIGFTLVGPVDRYGHGAAVPTRSIRWPRR